MNLDLSCCPPTMIIYTFIIEFSYMHLIDLSYNISFTPALV